MSPGIRRVSCALLTAMALGAVGGCAAVPISKSTTVASQDEAASVLMTPTTIVAWNDVADSLAPKFTMSGDAAVAKVLPTTEKIQEQVLQAFGASLGLGLPRISSSSTSTNKQTSQDTTSTTDGKTTSTVGSGVTGEASQTTTKGPGEVPDVPSGAPAGATLPGIVAPTGELGLDPVLQYKAANFLNQHVQMLNREVQTAAQRSCYVPYLVRMKLAVIPYRPRLAYALHTRAAFFLAKADERPPRPAADGKVHVDPCTDSWMVPQVVPLLAADDMQVALRSRATEAAQQIGLALSVMSHGVGANLGANSLNQSLQAIQNQDLSSRLTVSRQADNILYLRIAPNNEASGQPVMVGQTYDVAVLLLVPRGYFPAGVVPADARQPNLVVDTQTEYRNAFDGSLLPPRPQAALVARLDAILQPYLIYMPAAQRKLWDRMGPEAKAVLASSLVGPIQRGRYEEFRRILNCPNAYFGCPDAGVDPAGFNLAFLNRYGFDPVIWTAMSALIADTPFKSAVIQAPLPTAVTVGTDQTVFISDDGKDNALAVLRDVTAASAAPVTLRLELAPVEADGTSPRVLRIPATAKTLDSANRLMTVTFPSPTKWGVAKVTAGDTRNQLVVGLAACDAVRTLCPTLVGANAAGTVTLPVEWKMTGKPDTAAEFTLAEVGADVVAKEGVGRAAVTLDRLPAGQTVKLTVDGFPVTSVTNGTGVAMALDEGAYVLTGNGAYTINLFNLTPNARFTVTGQAIKDKKKVGGPAKVNFRVVGSE